MNLKFVINEKYLFYTALIDGVEVEGWEELQNTFWDKYRSGYQFLQGYLNKAFVFDEPFLYLSKSMEDAQKLVDEGMHTPLFNELLILTTEYKKWLEKNWNTNKDKVKMELKDILGIELPQTETNVLVVSNKMKGGQHIDSGVIMWGHSEDWPNYSLVYLAHEYLHDIFEPGELEHAVIELIADNELRVRLNKGGDYFVCDGNNVGHVYLKNIENSILADWHSYLKDKNRDIFDFVRKLKSKYPNLTSERKFERIDLE